MAKPPSKNVAAQIEISQVPEQFARKNFQNIKKFLDEETPLNGFRFVEFRITEAQADFKFHHKLGYIPRDFVITRVTGLGVVTLNYDKFDAETISVTTTAACVVRGFLGTYSKDTSADKTESVPQPMSYYTTPTGSTTSTSSSTTTSTSTSSSSTTVVGVPKLIQFLTPGSSTYTPSPTCVYYRVRMVGAGGGGAGTTGSAGAGSAGGDSVFGAITARGGSGGGAQSTTGSPGGAGGNYSGIVTGLGFGFSGGPGGGGGFSTFPGGGMGGSNPFGGAGGGGFGNASATAAKANTGAGGGGAGGGNVANAGGGGGGGAGAYVEAIFTDLSTVNITVGAKGAGGGGVTLGAAGADGAIIIEEY